MDRSRLPYPLPQVEPGLSLEDLVSQIPDDLKYVQDLPQLLDSSYYPRVSPFTGHISKLPQLPQDVMSKHILPSVRGGYSLSKELVPETQTDIRCTMGINMDELSMWNRDKGKYGNFIKKYFSIYTLADGSIEYAVTDYTTTPFLPNRSFNMICLIPIFKQAYYIFSKRENCSYKARDKIKQYILSCATLLRHPGVAASLTSMLGGNFRVATIGYMYPDIGYGNTYAPGDTFANTYLAGEQVSNIDFKYFVRDAFSNGKVGLIEMVARDNMFNPNNHLEEALKSDDPKMISLVIDHPMFVPNKIEMPKHILSCLNYKKGQAYTILSSKYDLREYMADKGAQLLRIFVRTSQPENIAVALQYPDITEEIIKDELIFAAKSDLNKAVEAILKDPRSDPNTRTKDGKLSLFVYKAILDILKVDSRYIEEEED